MPRRTLKKARTTTSPFGTKGRISHDSEKFYDSKLYKSMPLPERLRNTSNPFPEHCLNKVLCRSSEDMSMIPDCSLHLMITSPPYNVSKEYDTDLSLDEYLQLLTRVFKETHRVLIEGGRACVNVANLGRKPYIPLNSHVSKLMTDIGFFMRGEVIWHKGASAGSSTAWGSWMSASNPTLRDTHEYILIFSKGTYQRKDGRSTIGRDDFMEWTKSIWHFGAESAQRVGHPAPFPVELPHRLIQLFSFTGDIVLDPFVGSGTTGLAALKAGRRFLGFDTNEAYVKLAEQRLASHKP